MSINWAKLVQQGRAKSIGVSWTEEELKAVYEFKIAPEAVRAGILTPEQLDAWDGGVVLPEEITAAQARYEYDGKNTKEKVKEEVKKVVKKPEEVVEEKIKEKEDENGVDYDSMKMNELRKLAKDKGVKTKVGMTKQNIIDLLK